MLKRLAVATLAALLSLASYGQTYRPTQIRGISSDTVYGTGGIVTNGSPTITSPTFSGHVTVEGVTTTGATGTGNLVFSGSPVLTTPNLGTPSAVTLTNATGLPISTGVSGLGTGVATFLATPSSANLLAAVTDETGSGALVFGTSPTISGATLSGTTTAGAINSTGAITAIAAATQDAMRIQGRAGGTSSYAATLTPTTLTASRTLTLPDATDTLAVLGTAQTWTAAQTFRAANSVRAEAASTQDAIVLAGRAGGTSSYAATLTPGTLAGNVTLTLPVTTSTLAGLGVAQTWTAAQTFRAASAIRSEAASTQDAVVIAGRAGGTSSYAATLTPTTLTASRTLTLPDATDTLAVLGTAQTFSAAQTFSSTVTMSGTTTNIALGTSQTTGTWTGGGTAQTGAIVLGQSTDTQSVGIATGVATTGKTKTVNIGTAGASGSTTTITLGSSTGGATSGTTINGTLSLTGALTYSGVTLSNSVTGTGSMVLSASPTFTGTVTGATINATNFNGTIGATTPAAGTFTTLSATGQINTPDSMRIYKNGSNTFGSGPYLNIGNAAGSAGIVQQLNASNGLDWYNAAAASSPIMSLSTAGALSATGDIGAGADAGTAAKSLYASNSDGRIYVGKAGSGGNDIISGNSAYAGVIGTNSADPLEFGTNNTIRMTLGASGGLAVTGALSATGAGVIGGSSSRTNTQFSVWGANAKATASSQDVASFTSSDATGTEMALVVSLTGSAINTNRLASIQSVEQGAGYRELRLNPSGGNVSVGGNTPTAGILQAVGASGGISLALSDNVHNSLYVKHSAGNVVLGTDSGGGMTLGTNGFTPAISISSAQVVDVASLKIAGGTTLTNYTEGTCTLGYRGNVTAGTFTYSTQLCRYQRVGNRVTFDFDLVLSNITGSPSGQTEITGLPVTPANTAGAIAVCAVNGFSFTHSSTYDTLWLWVDPNTTTMRLLEAGAVAGVQQYNAFQVSGIATTASLRGVCSYAV